MTLPGREAALSTGDLLEIVFERGAMPLALVGDNEEIIVANGPFAQFLEYEAATLAGMRLADLRDGDQHLRLRSGATVPARINLTRVVDTDAGLRGLATIEDIRPQAAADAERARVDVRLRQAHTMQAVGQLTGGIAHDFNNMLTVILANAELLSEAMDPDGPGRIDLEELRTAARRGTSMVRKLLGFGRRERLVLQAVELGPLLQDLASSLRQALPARITLEIHAASTPAIHADPAAIERILLNLVSNAHDAIAGTGRISIRSALVRFEADDVQQRGWGEPGEYAGLTVSDTGMGMTEQVRERLFEPFFTTKPPGLGTGLGLAMIYGLMKQHGGFVEVDSTPGIGTSVRMLFPRAAGLLASLAPARPAPDPGGNETVLLVEDEEPIRRASRRVLERFGYRVLTASDGVEGLDILKARSADIALVISDVAMPRLGGRGLYDAARAAGCTVKFLFASGYTARDASAIGELDPSLPFVNKPWTVSEFLRRVRDVLDG